MANTQSAIKRIRSSRRKRLRNRILRGRANTALKRARLAIQAEQPPAELGATVEQAISALDRAAGKGVIHKNNAARRKSRLLKLLGKQSAPRA